MEHRQIVEREGGGRVDLPGPTDRPPDQHHQGGRGERTVPCCAFKTSEQLILRKCFLQPVLESRLLRF